jgi:glycosyltransferase involved in cell wall biosynthesis
LRWCLDVEAFADAVCQLATDALRRQHLGRHLAQRIREQHDVSMHAPRIVEIIRSMVT